MPSSTSDPLLSLLHQYASLQPLHQLELPSSLMLARNQDWIVDNVLLNPQLVRYPPDKRYRKGFLKILVARLEEGCSEGAEEEELEVLEPIYEAYVESMQSTSTEETSNQAPVMTSAPGASYKTFFYPLPTSTPASTAVVPAQQGLVTLREEQSIIQGGTTGLRTWIASLRLAEHLLWSTFASGSSHPTFPSRVLELGSGVGFLGALVGKVLAHQHPQDGGRLVLTDFDERVLDGLKANVELNELAPRISTSIERLDWYDALDTETSGEIVALRERLQPELIIAADVAYDPVLGPPLIATVRILLEPSLSRPKARALIATTIRIPATFEAFIELAREAGMTVQDLALPTEEIFWGCGEGGVVDTEVRLIELLVEGEGSV